MSWQPKLRPKGFPHSIDDFAVASMSELEHRSKTGEDKRDQRVFRVKRKHVLKACDRCRVKKTKPCNRCSVYNHPCLFRERKATQTKVYSRGFVEMLESHHSLVVKALQTLYQFCVNKEGFPGEPLAEAPDGHPLTHAILDRLGLIKQAEDTADEPGEDSEDLRYLRLLSTSTECSATAEPSPEPATPPEPSPTTVCRPAVCHSRPSPMTSRSHSHWQWDPQSVQQTTYSYPDARYQDMLAMQRPSIPSADLSAGEIDIPSGSSRSQGPHPHDQPPFAYFMDEGCSAAASSDAKAAVRLQTGIIPEAHPPSWLGCRMTCWTTSISRRQSLPSTLGSRQAGRFPRPD
ncbi:uncharacterized protein N7482_006070 [Penicillium canariense]|uniref:Zn(2)-C6 fungal-type domain-containing protein n=1 Tax=Penicillium canariense TaxID=189055 RepID=A0A9W9LMW6_9EURO|nr:uncharacterized protein N7482_006070 [Penicillium canariense]KAJ5167289.1 hypothetical protein N7482_006070 [Penicillium canariense]